MHLRFPDMIAFARKPRACALAAAAAVLLAVPLAPRAALAQILPWEIVVAEIEAGHLRGFAERLAKENVLYQLHLGETRRSSLVEAAGQIDRALESLEQGSPSYSIPAPWTPELRAQLNRVDEAWGPLRSIATAGEYDYFKVTRRFMPAGRRETDPLLLRYFDDMTQNFIAESEKLIDLYTAECRKTGLTVCAVAETTGVNTMLIERATRLAVYLVAGIDLEANRKALKVTLDAYQKRRKANEKSQFFADALNPERGVSAAAGAELLTNLRRDWDVMRKQLSMLAAGDEKNFDLRLLLTSQSRLVDKVERLTAALVRYASATYGT
jgi:hypothetical protein